MTYSLREIAKNCLNKNAPISILRDFFGYLLGYQLNGQVVSLKRQIQLMTGKAFNLNLIMVGYEGFDIDDAENMQNMIKFTRDIYSLKDLGVRRIEWHGLSETDVPDYITLDTKAEAKDLVKAYYVDNDGIDAFITKSYIHAGTSPINGTCDKVDGKDMNGLVASIDGELCFTGNTLAHELGHYLGLKHHTSATTNFIYGNGEKNSLCNTGIFTNQGRKMKKHCSVKDIC